MNEHPDSINIEDKLFEILIKHDDIQKKIIKLAESISIDYKNKEVVLICVLNGAFLFFGDLTKKLRLQNVIIDFIQLSSYKGNTENSGTRLIKDINTDITGKDVIIVEDIIDTGNSISFLKEHLKSLRQILSISLPIFSKALPAFKWTSFLLPCLPWAMPLVLFCNPSSWGIWFWAHCPCITPCRSFRGTV